MMKEIVCNFKYPDGRTCILTGDDVFDYRFIESAESATDTSTAVPSPAKPKQPKQITMFGTFDDIF